MARYDDEEEGRVFFGDDFSSGMQQFESYESYEVNEKNDSLKKQAEKVINNICDAYLSLPETDDEEDDPHLKKLRDYIKSIKEVETSNFLIIAKQVKIAEHILDTLIRRLDSGGYVDELIYQNIREQRKDLMDTVLQFSKYARNLPDYFSIVRSEVGLGNQMTLGEAITVQKQLNAPSMDLAIEENSEEEEYSAAPIRGTKDLALSVQDNIKKLKARQENMEETFIDFDPADITDDDEE